MQASRLVSKNQANCLQIIRILMETNVVFSIVMFDVILQDMLDVKFLVDLVIRFFQNGASDYTLWKLSKANFSRRISESDTAHNPSFC
jgi:hypothetical protein